MFNDNKIQFTRLLAEINLVGLKDSQVSDLCKSMDLEKEDIYNILSRAGKEWDLRNMKDAGASEEMIEQRRLED